MEQTTKKLIQQYFLPIRNREHQKEIFCRFSGFDDEFLEFLNRYSAESRKLGVCIRETIKNPTEQEVRFFAQTIGEDCSFDVQGRRVVIDKWLSEQSATQRRLIFETLEQYLQYVSKDQVSENVLQNTFVKILCWLKFYFVELLFLLPFVGTPKILYEGALGKYQLVLLKMLQTLGCDVVTVSFAENPTHELQVPEYCQTERIRMLNTGIPPRDFEQGDWKEKADCQHFFEELQKAGQGLNTNNWLEEKEPLEAMFYAGEVRQLSGKTANLYVEYCGVSNPGEYEGELYRFYTRLTKEKKPFILIEGRIPSPTVEEIQPFEQFSRDDKLRLLSEIVGPIQLYKNAQMNVSGQRALYKILSQGQTENPSQLYNLGISLLCWTKRYKELFQFEGTGQMPVLIYYGRCKGKLDMAFLEFLSLLPVDIVIFSPDLQARSQIKHETLLRIEYPNSLPIGEFPQKEQRTMAGTTAYRAERELEQILYTDTGLFRARQFRNAVPVNLKTTYEEIEILWKEPAKFRPFFETGENQVTVPNIVAKISGVKNGNITEYNESIRRKITKDTLLIRGVPHLRGTDPNPIKSHVTKLVRNKELQVNEIKKHKDYKYDYLPEDVQDFILSKIQMLINEDVIQWDGGGLEYAIVAVLLNLDQKTVRMIQNFEFTEQIPKLIMIDTDETMCSLEDCIYVMFLSLIGFDVLIYSPPGYRVIDKYLKNQILKEHIIGEYVFDMELPRLDSEERGGRGLIGKLFGKGRE